MKIAPAMGASYFELFAQPLIYVSELTGDLAYLKQEEAKEIKRHQPRPGRR